MKSDHAHIPLVQAAREQGSISVWRMPTSLSQSRLGGRNSPSNACTVIAVRMAEVIHRTDTKMPSAIYRTKATYECDGRQVSSRNQRAAAGHEGVPEIKNNSEKETNLAKIEEPAFQVIPEQQLELDTNHFFLREYKSSSL
ncbi:hypothetical protein NECAME_09691 [Necator americanus]|uniref:Uncharacterized protein n=1 Tax=Necator americanus TaxID=51031 RepID=W2TC62_NECAM|nr:hypothetical protein NECAME_09691 [Necator americanus]ETN79645.1 hypothetical protein NECAME_09691 [Necator americanus]